MDSQDPPSPPQSNPTVGTAHRGDTTFQVQLIRSAVITPSERSLMERQYMDQLRSGAGLFGTRKINLAVEKSMKLAGLKSQSYQQSDAAILNQLA